MHRTRPSSDGQPAGSLLLFSWLCGTVCVLQLLHRDVLSLGVLCSHSSAVHSTLSAIVC
jgi:hypothetical protein